MRVKLTGNGAVDGIEKVATVPQGQLIYDSEWRLTVDPESLVAGDSAIVAYGCAAIVLTVDPELVEDEEA